MTLEATERFMLLVSLSSLLLFVLFAAQTVTKFVTTMFGFGFWEFL